PGESVTFSSIELYTKLVYNSLMQIAFATDEIEALCKEQKRATRALGAESAKKLQRRLAELFNADNPAELVAGRPHPLKGDKHGLFALDLHGGARLVFQPSVQPPPQLKDGGIDWLAVKAITITALEDYHD
ncbi:type II toxin-antitoxin system RelE/ParE family toxin, partial [Rhodoferax sp.]|uniref:type II toxin-antitoxin system RelE/ParE family toxin n=1 Tax=Rhodoferax sp. TaxID=50421 RepID=UPI00374CDAFE